jgi:sortase A
MTATQTLGGTRRIGEARRRPLSLPVPKAYDISVARRVTAWTLAGLAALLAWLVLFALVLSRLSEAHAQHGLYADFRAELAAATAPVGGAIKQGAPVALLTAPAGGLDGVVVVEGTSSTALRSGPGHVPGNPLPGQAGVSVLMGRSTTFGGPFGRITDLARGDIIDVTTGQGLFHYWVEDVRRAGDPFPPALKAGGSQLTLVTSDGAGWRSGFAPSHAVFVDALLQGPAQPAPANLSVPTTADGLLHGDSRGLYPLVLWLQLLAVAITGGVWLGLRWGRSQSWLVTTPVVVAALWGASNSLWQLLPNLL